MERRLIIIKSITNFIFAEDLPTKADLIIVPGSSHIQLPRKAAYLYKKKFAGKIIFTGGFNPKIGKKECDFGKEVALKSEISRKDILCEGHSTNTKKNALAAAKIVKKYHLPHRIILLVCKPHHARRMEMTFIKSFPKSKLIIIPVKDGRNITKDNWWKDEKKTARIMEEVGKISEYFLKGDLSLN